VTVLEDDVEIDRGDVLGLKTDCHRSSGQPTRLVIVDGMDPVLKRPGDAPSDRAASDSDPDRPLAPGLAAAAVSILDDLR
jgi:hypothetical protein